MNKKSTPLKIPASKLPAVNDMKEDIELKEENEEVERSVL